MNPVTLETPSSALLSGYIAAMLAGWSPNTTRDVRAEHLAAIDADTAAFLAGLQPGATGMVTIAGGTQVPRLPGATYWISDGAFCGMITYRHMPGTADLPPHVSGHVGYSVVPAKRGRGIATTALRLLLPILRQSGLPRVLLTCDETNEASRRVIEANGGLFAGIFDDPLDPAIRKRHFWIRLADPEAAVDRPPAG